MSDLSQSMSIKYHISSSFHSEGRGRLGLKAVWTGEDRLPRVSDGTVRASRGRGEEGTRNWGSQWLGSPGLGRGLKRREAGPGGLRAGLGLCLQFTCGDDAVNSNGADKLLVPARCYAVKTGCSPSPCPHIQSQASQQQHPKLTVPRTSATNRVIPWVPTFFS